MNVEPDVREFWRSIDAIDRQERERAAEQRRASNKAAAT